MKVRLLQPLEGYKLKSLNESFTDAEFEALKQAKQRVGGNWHDFIMLLSHASYTEALVRRMFKPIKVSTVKPPKEAKVE